MISGRIRGRAYCIGGVLDVDWDISPVEDMFFVRDAQVRGTSEKEQMERLASHCLVKADPNFIHSVRPGDFLVGSRGLGWGHGHDHAALALRAVGIGAVICETTTVNFKRNCINHGVPLLEIEDIFSQTETGDDLELDLEEGSLRNMTTGVLLRFERYPRFILDTLYSGGVYEHIRSVLDKIRLIKRN